LEAFNSEIPSYNNYLCYILCNPIATTDVRAIAGLLLKNNCKRFYEHIQFDYIKHAILQALSDDVELIRSTAGTVITTLLTGRLGEWPEVLPKMVELSDSPNQKVSEVHNLVKEAHKLGHVFGIAQDLRRFQSRTRPR